MAVATQRGHPLGSACSTASAVVAALTKPGIGQGDVDVFNVGRGVKLPLLDLLRTIAALSGRDADLAFAEPRAGDVYHSCADPTRMNELLGVTADTDLATGLAATLGWMQGRVAAT